MLPLSAMANAGRKTPSILSRARASLALFRASGRSNLSATNEQQIRNALTTLASASPRKEIEIPKSSLQEYYELAAARTNSAQASVAGQLDPHQTKVPQYPTVDGTSLQRLGYHRNEVVRRTYDLIIESATQAIPQLVTRRGQVIRGSRGLAFEELMEFPYGEDSDITGMDMWVRFWLDALGTGNGMLEMVPGKGTDYPVRLLRMDPARTYIVPHEEHRIDHYAYRLGGQYFKIPRERVLHYRMWDPLDDFWGIPRLFSAMRSLATDSDLIDMLKVTFQNLGVPPVVLEYPLADIIKGIESGATSIAPDPDVLDQVSDRWAEKYSGRNRGKAAVAWGYTVKLIGLDFDKLAIGELVATTERRILMAHGVNPMLVGQSGSEQQRGHNFEGAKEFFFGTTISGLLRQVAGVFSARLARQFGTGFKFKFETDNIGAIRDAKLRRGDKGAEIFKSGVLTRHAVQRLMGEKEDGDDIFYPDVYGSAAQREPSSIVNDPEDESDD